jgi:hypothetical protein|tara:strand:+ start:384 stop:536 length:153 start_codon:yes stop_codon:yes gene_type:complete
MPKYYKVDRFIKIQKIDKSNEDRVEPDWVEVNEDGSPLESKPKKAKSKGE